jgi:hypothetical protein
LRNYGVNGLCIYLQAIVSIFYFLFKNCQTIRTVLKIKLNQSSNFKRWKGLPSENNLRLVRISVAYPCMLSKTCLSYFRCVQLPLQLLNYEQQGSSSENEKQWMSMSWVCVCKAASTHAHPRVNDPWNSLSIVWVWPMWALLFSSL